MIGNDNLEVDENGNIQKPCKNYSMIWIPRVLFKGPLEDTQSPEPEVSDNPPEVWKSSKLKLRKDGFDDDLFKKFKFKKLGLELGSDTEDQAKVDSIAKKIDI